MRYLGLNNRSISLGHHQRDAAHYLLDDYTAAIAFSLRRLRKAYTGNCIRVRRDNDDAEQDIGFDNFGLDLTALFDFVGANSAYVVTWYDQSGNSHDVTQSTASLQPRIMLNGSLQTGAGGKPGIFFDGSDYLVRTTHDINGEVSAVCTFHVFATRLNMSGDTGHGCLSHMGQHDANVYWTMGAVSGAITGETTTFLSDNNTARIATSETNYDLSGSEYVVEDWISTSSGVEMYSNNDQKTFDIFGGGASASTDVTPTTHTTDYSTVGCAVGCMAWNGSTNFHLDGVLQEAIHIFSDISSSRLAIRENINSYYGLY